MFYCGHLLAKMYMKRANRWGRERISSTLHRSRPHPDYKREKTGWIYQSELQRVQAENEEVHRA
jgi:hypothetical protein